MSRMPRANSCIKAHKQTPHSTFHRGRYRVTTQGTGERAGIEPIFRSPPARGSKLYRESMAKRDRGNSTDISMSYRGRGQHR